MKHIKRDFSLKAWVRPHGWTKRVGQGPKFQLFQSMVVVHIKLKRMTQAVTW